VSTGKIKFLYNIDIISIIQFFEKIHKKDEK